MARPVGGFLERMGVYDGRPLLHVYMGKERHAAVIRDKQHRQQPPHISHHRLSHLSVSLSGREDTINTRSPIGLGGKKGGCVT